MTQDQLQYQVEELIDQSSLQDVLMALAETASYKADHIRSNWQDDVLAETWEKASQVLYQTGSALGLLDSAYAQYVHDKNL